MNRIHVVYRISAEESAAARIARGIALEQTVEVPERLVSAAIEESVVGRIESLTKGPEGSHLADISYDVRLCGFQIPQLLNLIYGNTTMQRGIRVVDLRFPQEMLRHFRGPRYGIEGIRKILGVYDRPLLASALKPNGAPIERLERIAYEFALGGGDIIKDDQNLVDGSFEAYRERVTRCQAAVLAANQETGRNCLYFPYVGGPVDRLAGEMRYLASLGIRGYLVAPLLLGMETARYLTDHHDMIAMGHPSLSGVFYVSEPEGMNHELLLGTLFRLIGMDISVFVNVGGRFRFDRKDCVAIAEKLVQPMGDLKPAFPSPAGGMHLSNIGDMSQDYGVDSCLLIGGALLGHSESVETGTRIFLDEIRSRFHERMVAPRGRSRVDDDASSCEVGGRATAHAVLDRLIHQGFQWHGREFTEYKLGGRDSFEGVRRVELIGGGGENTAFDLRYFEIEPGGHSSLEKHAHTHTIIGVRGAGTLLKGDRKVPLERLDIAYVDSLQSHQLRNESDEPFGFFCIVDHIRDRPVKA